VLAIRLAFGEVRFLELVADILESLAYEGLASDIIIIPKQIMIEYLPTSMARRK
jgi:hypothetical protein